VLREGWYPGASSFFWIYPPMMHQQSSIILAPAAGAEVAIPAIQSEEMGFQTIALAQEETLRLRAMHRNMFCLNSSGCLCETGTIISPMILASWSKVHANYCHQSFKNRVHPKFLVINRPIFKHLIAIWSKPRCLSSCMKTSSLIKGSELASSHEKIHAGRLGTWHCHTRKKYNI